MSNSCYAVEATASETVLKGWHSILDKKTWHVASLVCKCRSKGKTNKGKRNPKWNKRYGLEVSLAVLQQINLKYPSDQLAKCFTYRTLTQKMQSQPQCLCQTSLRRTCTEQQSH